jgi:hypothetical protein
MPPEWPNRTLAEPPVPTTRAELREYLRWQREEWLPAVTMLVQARHPVPAPPRPRLTLIQDGG